MARTSQIFFSALDRTLLKGFQSFGGYLPGVSVPLVKEKMREEAVNVILPGEVGHLRPHLEARRAQGIRMAVNFPGEALLGCGAARTRLEAFMAALQEPAFEVTSVKATPIYSQISQISTGADQRVRPGNKARCRSQCHRRREIS